MTNVRSEGKLEEMHNHVATIMSNVEIQVSHLYVSILT